MRLVFNPCSYILILLSMFLCSCSLFRKTTRTTDVATQSSTNRLESSQLVLKTSGKETQIFTYWNDSGFYQYQHIKEQIDQAKVDQLIAIAQDERKRTISTKIITPTFIWGWIVLVIFLALWFVWYRIRR